MIQPLTLKNARIWDGQQAEIRDLYISDKVLDKPALGALTVDLDGYTIFPGLINAHDHLELNHYPRTKFREVYNNAHEWGEDINVRLNESPFKELRAYPLADRLFIGGLKNLLCGATTVAHHNSPHKELFRKDFPVHVLKKYGWAHSLHFSTEAEIVESYRKTPKDTPWFIHLAEGTDEVAAGEYRRLMALGCIGKNTVIVHGVGISSRDSVDAYKCGASLAWCPSTNLYLLEVKLQALHELIIRFWEAVALGSDSRLTANGDLLDELRVAFSIACQIDVGGDINYAPHWVIATATELSARLLSIQNVGSTKANSQADLIAIRSGNNAPYDLCASHRANLALVMRGGIPQIGDPEVMAKFPHVETVPATLDGAPKSIQIDLARRIVKCSLKEPGLEILEQPERRKVFGLI
jgi:cytosine/adenosine deaminase-related metal-dependent hydrolase